MLLFVAAGCSSTANMGIVRKEYAAGNFEAALAETSKVVDAEKGKAQE